MRKSILPRWLRKLARKAISEPPLVFIAGYMRHTWRKWDYQCYVEEGYEGNPFVHRPVSYIARGVGSLKWQLHEMVGNEEVVHDEHPILEPLKRPSRWFGGSQFFQHIVLHLLLGGYSVVLKVGPDGPKNTGETIQGKARQTMKPPAKLHLLTPDTVYPVQGDNLNPIKAFRYKASGMSAKVDYLPDDCIYFRMPNALDPLNGFPPLKAAAKAVDSVNEAHTWNMSVLKKGGKIQGYWVVGGEDLVLTDDQHKKLKSRISEEVQGAENMGGEPLLSGDIKHVNTGVMPSDMEWDNVLKIGAREIALVLHFPPKLCYDSEDQNYASLEAAKSQAMTEAVLPLANMIRDELNVQYVPDFNRDGTGNKMWLDYDKDAIPELQESQDALWKRATEAWYLEINERRKMVGHESTDGGDVILVPASLTPLEAMNGEGPNTEE